MRNFDAQVLRNRIVFTSVGKGGEDRLSEAFNDCTKATTRSRASCLDPISTINLSWEI